MFFLKINSFLLTKINLVFGIAEFFAILLVHLRNANAYPTVFGDEYTYLQDSQFRDLASVGMPNYVFYVLFRFTGIFGSDFYVAAKVLNELLLVLTSITFYMLAKKYIDKRLSAFIAVLFTLSPFNFYSSFYLPETLFQCVFMIVSYLVLTVSSRSWIWKILFFTLLGTLLALIRPHGISSLIALGIYTCFLPRSDVKTSRDWLKQILSGFAVVALGLFLRQSLIQIVTNTREISPLGRTYGETFVADPIGPQQVESQSAAPLVPVVTSPLPETTTVLEHWFSSLPIITFNHLAAMSLLFGLALTHLISKIPDSPTRFGSLYSKVRELRLFVLFMAMGGISLSISFSVHTNWVIGEPLERLHMRYYSFIFPLIILLFAALWQNGVKPSKLAIFLTAILTVAGSLFGTYANSVQYQDAPDLFAVTYSPAIYGFVICLTVTSLLLGITRSRLAGQLFLFLIYPFITILSLAGSVIAFQLYSTPTPGDTIGKFLKSNLSESDVNHSVIIAADLRNPLHAAFFLRGSPKTYVIPNQDTQEILSKIHPDTKHLILVGFESKDLEKRFPNFQIIDGGEIFSVTKGN